jgi:hypothetical protein
MYSVSYFRHNRWHTRLFWVRNNAVAYANTFPLTVLIHCEIPNY